MWGPTPKMVAAGQRAQDEEEWDQSTDYGVEAGWNAMIDAALEEDDK